MIPFVDIHGTSFCFGFFAKVCKMVHPIAVTVLLFLKVAFSYSQQFRGPITCPPGFVPANTSGLGGGEQEKTCLCGEVWKHFNASRTVRCKDTDSEKFDIYTGHCLTYSAPTNSLSIGPCPYNLKYRTLTLNVSELGVRMCAPFNRKGRLCEECMEGFWPSISRSMHCKQCNMKISWFKYITLQVVLPSSLFFTVIMISNLQFSSSPLNSLVLFCQLVYSCLYYDARLHSLLHRGTGYTTSNVFYEILMACCGILNLDFHYIFKFNKLSQVCLGPSTKGVHILMLKYLEAFSPLLLVLAVSLCIYIHSKNCKLLVISWKCILKIFPACLKMPTKDTSSKRLCNAFIAFFVLAYSKILYVSLNFLIPNKTYEIIGTTITEHWSLYFDPTIKYFGREHIPYAILAITMLTFFVISPLLILVLYLFKPIGAFYSRVLGSRWHIMHYFIDAFQGWYKNGTDNTSYDYRLVFAIFPVLKILSALWMCVFTGAEHRGSRIWLVPSMVLQGTGLFFAAFRPYKSDTMNKLDALLIWLLGTILFTLVHNGNKEFTLALTYLPLPCVLVYATYKFIHWASRQGMVEKFKNCCCSCQPGRHTYRPLVNNDQLKGGELDERFN